MAAVRIPDIKADAAAAAASERNHVPVIALAAGSCDYVTSLCFLAGYKTYGDVVRPRLAVIAGRWRLERNQPVRAASSRRHRLVLAGQPDPMYLLDRQ